MDRYRKVIQELMGENGLLFEYKRIENMLITARPDEYGETFIMFHIERSRIDNFCVHSQSIDTRLIKEVNLLISEINSKLEPSRFYLDKPSYNLVFSSTFRKIRNIEPEAIRCFCNHVFESTRKYTREIYEIASYYNCQ